MGRKAFKPPRRINSDKTPEKKSSSTTSSAKSAPKSSLTSNKAPAPTTQSSAPSDKSSTTPSSKRNVNNSTPNQTKTPPSSSLDTKKPKKGFKPPKIKTTISNSEKERQQVEQWRYFTVMHTKRSTKKHKVYDDGILVVKLRKYVLQDVEGKVILERLVGKTLDDLKVGEVIEVGSREIEIAREVSQEEYTSGRVFLEYSNLNSSSDNTTQVSSTPQTASKFRKHSSSKVKASGALDHIQDKEQGKAPAGAVILQNGSTKGSHDVWVDPKIGKYLRPHQIEGVQFMYECVLGQRNYNGNGCLLADDMGLGKTLQCIALFWTLLKRGPLGKPALKKIIIVTPSSLVQSWRKEIKKWLGRERLQPVVVTTKNSKSAVQDFKIGYHHVMIISYDLCVKRSDELEQCPCDLMICDEGHRLKNTGIKTVQILRTVDTRRRIIVSGTPLQNNVDEFFSIVDFINPGLLGTARGFKNLFTDPITRGRDPSASLAERETGEARSSELTRLTNQFVLRRTADVLSKHLPPKKELVVFTKMCPLQESLYKHFIKSKFVKKLMLEADFTLTCIHSLRKLLAHPNLIYKLIQENGEDDAWEGALDKFPSNYHPSIYTPQHSSKMQLLENLLRSMYAAKEKIVVVSNFTSTLTELELMCKHHDYKFCRLDGQTPSDKRMDIVDYFNDPDSNSFVFLLSSKAGGVGLNLVGASRLVLFDPDWNPSNDLQAMARIWRDGQKKDVYIYRFLSTGTIEEKIFQRQLVKIGLSKAVVDEKHSKIGFSKRDLKELFTYVEDTHSDTYPKEADTDFRANIDQEDPLLSKAIGNHSNVTFAKVLKLTTEEALAQMSKENNSISGSDNESTNKEESTKNDGEEESEAEYEFSDGDNVDNETHSTNSSSPNGDNKREREDMDPEDDDSSPPHKIQKK
eukprot:gb/GECH01009654.1/.p1 GENE.gb/GECH01009654.1/~~gb/GECH01009654.1/.p1  ORF type:complete len:914 (+),score=151.79 gb/GECH01009654.1/:1-2742(+)